jgi:hypothetical protein
MSVTLVPRETSVAIIAYGGYHARIAAPEWIGEISAAVRSTEALFEHFDQ